MAAVITIAARADCGRLRIKPGTNISITSTAAAATSPVNWVLAPDCSATAVRDPLVLTGNPWNRLASRLADPMPISSWLLSTV